MDLVQYQADRALGGRAPSADAPGSTVAPARATLEPGAFTLIAALPLDAPSDQLRAAAEAARSAGARLLLGRVGAQGAVRPEPPAALEALAACGRATGLPCIAEVRTAGHVRLAASLAEVLQVPGGDPELLDAAAGTGLPVLVERGPAATVAEWLAAADVLTRGGPQVVLSAPAVTSPDRPEEPGVDLAAVLVARERSGLPVVVNPSAMLSGAAGSTATVVALARAAAAVGADGVVVPTSGSVRAGSGEDAAGLDPAALAGLAAELRALAGLSGRRMAARRIRYVGRRG